MKEAILLIIFNRPEVTARTFDVIRDARPPILLVVADGPYDNKSAERVRQTRLVINVDWPCDVHYYYSDVHLGCAERMITGITWAFTLVPRVIIIEDDCLLDPTFFSFADDLLDRYENNQVIGMITAQGRPISGYQYSYYFSRVIRIWGWATWSDRWALYDRRLTNWPEIKGCGFLSQIIPPEQIPFFHRLFDTMHSQTEAQTTWDYQWWYTILINNLLVATPTQSMVTNIGFGPGATHTLHRPDSMLASGSLAFPLQHPECLIDMRSIDCEDRFNEH